MKIHENPTDVPLAMILGGALLVAAFIFACLA
jgi:hypothetical protein